MEYYQFSTSHQNSNMAALQVHDDGCVNLLDLETGHMLLNATREEVEKGASLKEYPNASQIDVGGQLNASGMKENALLRWDEMPHF
jgi:hypothetical protein